VSDLTTLASGKLEPAADHTELYSFAAQP